MLIKVKTKDDKTRCFNSDAILSVTESAKYSEVWVEIINRKTLITISLEDWEKVEVALKNKGQLIEVK